MKTSAAHAPISKLDLYQVNKAEYATPRKPSLLRIAKANYLGIAGRGAPGGEAFQQAIGALYSIAFTIKMASKFAGRDYGVCKLEGQWWVDSGCSFMTAPKDQWSWRLLIRTPEFIGKREMEAARKQLESKGKDPLFKEVQLTPLNEGLCVQMLHAGPYDSEAESIRLMEAFAGEQGYRFDGLHHEIYLSDPRRVAPEKLRTILRIPVKPIK
ncbi:MAG TPA: GyrI-like domain-containing protein [Bryobacteraceae bacterium]|nr:GyrI-like domain-containing protein [Bryobacteraceae bacterium]